MIQNKFFWNLTILLGFLLSPHFAWAYPPLDSESESGDSFNRLDLGIFQENNRTLGYSETFRATYRNFLTENSQIEGGLAWNMKDNEINAMFVDYGLEDIFAWGWNIHLKLLVNQYPEYSKSSVSIIPYLNWDGGPYYFSFGLNYRSSNSYGNPLGNIFNYHTDVFELILYYNLGIRYLFPELGLITSLEINNNDPMYAGNLGAYELIFKNKLMLRQGLFLFANLGLRQSGSIGLSSTYYATTFFWGLEERF